jgi:sphingolipid delta-4 desaturase
VVLRGILPAAAYDAGIIYFAVGRDFFISYSRFFFWAASVALADSGTIIYDFDQETFSYYGPINRVALNMGYHNEHHDLPSIPWNNLPKLRAMAPEFYDNLKYHRSWTRSLFQFIFDERYSLFSRVERMRSRDSGTNSAPNPNAPTSAVNGVALNAKLNNV